MCAHLSVAGGRGLISLKERDDLSGRYERIGKGLTRWIQYLERREQLREAGVADPARESATDETNNQTNN